jgi:hypothetical protein
MLWVYFIAAIGLLGIIIETWMSHRKEMAQVRDDIQRVRAGIRQHESANSGIEDKRQTSVAHAAELKEELDRETAEAELKRQELEELLELWRKHHPGEPFDEYGRS